MRQDVKTWWKLIWSTHWSVHCGNIFPATMWRANHHICSSTTHKHTFINSTLKSDMKTKCWSADTPSLGGDVRGWVRRQADVCFSRWWQLTTATGAVGPAASLWVTAHRLCLCMKLFIVWICGNVWPDRFECVSLNMSVNFCVCVCYCRSISAAHSILVSLSWSKPSICHKSQGKDSRYRHISGHIGACCQPTNPHSLPLRSFTGFSFL